MYHQISPSNVIVKYHSTSSGRNMVKHTYTHTHSFPFFSSFLSSFSFALLRFLRGIRLWLRLGLRRRLGLLGFWQRRWLKTMSWQISADQNKLQEDWDADKNSASIYGYEFNLVGMKLTPTNPPINKQWLSMSDQNINQGGFELKQRPSRSSSATRRAMFLESSKPQWGLASNKRLMSVSITKDKHSNPDYPDSNESQHNINDKDNHDNNQNNNHNDHGESNDTANNAAPSQKGRDANICHTYYFISGQMSALMREGADIRIHNPTDVPLWHRIPLCIFNLHLLIEVIMYIIIFYLSVFIYASGVFLKRRYSKPCFSDQTIANFGWFLGLPVYHFGKPTFEVVDWTWDRTSLETANLGSSASPGGATKLC